jgi:hypothetical protein
MITGEEDDEMRVAALKPQNILLANPETLEDVRRIIDAPYPGLGSKDVAMIEAAWAGDVEAIFSLAVWPLHSC